MLIIDWRCTNLKEKIGIFVEEKFTNEHEGHLGGDRMLFEGNKVQFEVQI